MCLTTKEKKEYNLTFDESCVVNERYDAELISLLRKILLRVKDNQKEIHFNSLSAKHVSSM